MKQTAVEFFEDELKDKLGTIVINKNWELLEQIIEQAKEREKQQIVESFSLGIISHHDAFKNQNKWNNGEEYYNETFKSE